MTLSGTNALAGGLRVRPLGTYVPLPGTRLELLTLAPGQTSTGNFTGISHTLPRPGLRVALDRAGDTFIAVFSATPGDANLDAFINFADLMIVAQNYNRTGVTWLRGDFTGDGVVSFDDLVVLGQNYNSSATFGADWALAESLAPEPAFLTILAGAATVMTRRRQRTSSEAHG